MVTFNFRNRTQVNFNCRSFLLNGDLMSQQNSIIGRFLSYLSLARGIYLSHFLVNLTRPCRFFFILIWLFKSSRSQALMLQIVDILQEKWLDDILDKRLQTLERVLSFDWLFCAVWTWFIKGFGEKILQKSRWLWWGVRSDSMLFKLFAEIRCGVTSSFVKSDQFLGKVVNTA